MRELERVRTAGRGRLGAIARLLLLAALLVIARPGGTAAAAESTDRPSLPVAPGDVRASLEQALAWYQRTRAAMRSINESAGAVFAREDEQTVLRVLERAFDIARAQAALLDRESARATTGAPPPGKSERAAAREQLQAEIQQDQEQLARLRSRLRTAPARMRAALQREAAAATNRLALNGLRLDFMTKIGQLDSSISGADGDLTHQIQVLQDAVPEAHQSGRTPPAANPASTDASSSGTRALIHRLLALQRGRHALKEVAASTSELRRDVDAALHATRTSVRPMMGRLRALAKEPSPPGAPLDEGAREFRDLLDRVKLLGGVVLPLREEAALLHRFSDNLDSARRAIDRASRDALEGVVLQLTGVAVAIGVIVIGAVLWRIAAVRYVADRYRRRIVMGARNVVVAAAVVLVVLFHFTSELAALVTILGFAAAGIAFALQNVILAVAGYFSIVAPNGIRVGDRVSLQGPFGYVHGEVTEIGLLRLRLHELAGDQLAPTGRIVVFPNSVVFTGSFFKHSGSEVPR